MPASFDDDTNQIDPEPQMNNPILMAELAPQRLRGGVNRLQWVYVALLLAEIALCLFVAIRAEVVRELFGHHVSWQAAIWDYYTLFYVQHVAALTLLAPIFAAGSLNREKTQRTFELLLTTELTDADIALGKWAAHVFQATRWTLPSWPVLAFFQGLLGLPGPTLAWWLAGTILWTAAATTVGLTFSALMRNTAVALLASYVVLAALIVGLLVFADLGRLLPWDAPTIAVAWRSPSLWALLAVAVLPLAVLSLSLRPLHRWENRGVKPDTSPERASLPPVGDEPIYWKQRWLGSVLRVPFFNRLPREARTTFWVGLSCIVMLILDWAEPLAIAVALGILIAIPTYGAIVASAAYSGEREAGTWDSLRTTLLRPLDFVDQHHRAITARMRVVWLLLLLPLSVGSLRAVLMEPIDDVLVPILILMYGWGIAFTAIPFSVAAGLHSSAKASTMWRSLIPTFGYLAVSLGVVTLLATVPLAMLLQRQQSPNPELMLAGFVGAGILYGVVTMLHLDHCCVNELWAAKCILSLQGQHQLELDTEPREPFEKPRRKQVRQKPKPPEGSPFDWGP
jgi:ABC-type transport system involved in multi-copper enzyme maturation permease subunit